MNRTFGYVMLFIVFILLLSLVAMTLAYITMGIGNGENCFLSLIFIVLNGWTIAASLYPSIIARKDAYYFSDGLLLARIMKRRESLHD